ncbi:Peroxisome biogenesis factor 10 [Pseudocercospora fuligena]|uniref:Peroxisome biogenesis factor 10 n=1 Tax=Pseudocercospora fuligena TaxID=685502 RepID=A0A8H6VFH5_9PEZI|nr:Peroxisome biogenesis factor 10 [Pseudocercospora fuligena]
MEIFAPGHPTRFEPEIQSGTASNQHLLHRNPTMSIPSQGNFYHNGGLEPREVLPETTCDICMDPIVDAVTTPCPCNMVFCREHIKEWLDFSGKCPTCRTRFFYRYPPGLRKETPDETYQDITARMYRRLFGGRQRHIRFTPEHDNYLNFCVAWKTDHGYLSDAEQESILPKFVWFDSSVLELVVVRKINRQIFSGMQEGGKLSHELENWLFEAGRSFVWFLKKEHNWMCYYRTPVKDFLQRIVREVLTQMDFAAADDARREDGQEDIPNRVRHHVPAEIAADEADILKAIGHEILGDEQGITSTTEQVTLHRFHITFRTYCTRPSKVLSQQPTKRHIQAYNLLSDHHHHRTMALYTRRDFYNYGGLEPQVVSADSTCHICMELISEPVAIPCPCRGVFCRECITKWLDQSGECPTCRTKFFEAPETFDQYLARAGWRHFGEDASIFNMTRAQSDYISFRREFHSQNPNWQEALRNSPSPTAVFFGSDALLAEMICMLTVLEYGEVRDGRAFQGASATWFDDFGRALLRTIRNLDGSSLPRPGLYLQIFEKVSDEMDSGIREAAREQDPDGFETRKSRLMRAAINATVVASIFSTLAREEVTAGEEGMNTES